MKKYLLAISFIFINHIVFAQIYSQVKIYTDAAGLKKISSSGVAIDHGECKKGIYFISAFSQNEIQIIKSLGFQYDILIDDLSKKPIIKDGENAKNRAVYNCNQSANYQIPQNWQHGSMAGYFTYQEMLDNLDAMAAAYPNLITVKQPIDNSINSIENQPIYFVKVSDNPNQNEPEPEMLYDAVHHAREPGSMSQMIFYLWYLLENYATNPEIAFIINNTQLYFVPCVNPDGYMFNQTTNPNGGGFWRKNRRDNGGNVFGVDLNRNYGGLRWGLDDIGSSPNTNSETYRGTSGFSEPELDAFKNFINQHQFKIALNYHTYGNDVIYPYGYAPGIYTPDSLLFVNMAQYMTAENGYTYGTGDQTVGYVTNGDSDDWMYEEQVTKPKIMAFTPEVGDAFWMDEVTLDDICLSVLPMNIKAAKMLTNFAVLVNESAISFNQNTGTIKYKLTKLGFENSGDLTVALVPLSTSISATGAPKIYSNFIQNQFVIDSISYNLDMALINYGDEIKFDLTLNNGLFIWHDTISLIFGDVATLFNSTGSTMNNFYSNAWGVSSEYFVTPSSSICDSPFANYNDNDYNELLFDGDIDLVGSLAASLQFFTKWTIEPNYDYAQVVASNDGGNFWQPLCGLYTSKGGPNQALDEPIYDGTQVQWVREKMSLNDYLGQIIKLKIHLVSDNAVNYDGIYIDDVVIEKVLDTPLGLSTIKHTNFEIFPNPADNVLNFVFSTEILNAQFEIYNSVGQLSLMGKLAANKNASIDISKLNDGIYLVKIIDSSGSYLIQKINVKH